MKCACGSYAINQSGNDPDLCYVCYWRKRAATDCRTCRFFVSLSASDSLHNECNAPTCTNADKYEAMTPLKLWKTT